MTLCTFSGLKQIIYPQHGDMLPALFESNNNDDFVRFSESYHPEQLWLLHWSVGKSLDSIVLSLFVNNETAMEQAMGVEFDVFLKELCLDCPWLSSD